MTQGRTCKVRDLGQIITGHTPPTKERRYYGDHYPLIKANRYGAWRTLYRLD